MVTALGAEVGQEQVVRLDPKFCSLGLFQVAFSEVDRGANRCVELAVCLEQ